MKDAFQWMVPFLHRCEGRREGAAKSLLKDYLVSLAQHDLTLPLLIFQHSKPDVSIPTRRRGHTRATSSPPSGCLRRVKAGAASLSRRCFMYDPARTAPRAGRRGCSLMHPTCTRTHTQKGKKNALKCAPSVSRALMHAPNMQALVFLCVAVPAEDHRGPGPADGGRPGVHLQL